MTCPFEAVLFDLDGTLLDTLDDLAESMNGVLRMEGLPVHPAEAYRYFVGDGVEMLVFRSLPESLRSEERVCRLVPLMRSEYRRRWGQKTHPYPGVPELVQGLAERRMPMAVLSNKPDDMTRLMVAHFFPGGPFRVVMGARPDRPRKPDPSAAREIAAVLGVVPGRVLYLGDSGTDMRTAVAAGMVPIGVLWGFRDAEELSANGARQLIKHPEDAVAILSP